MESIEQMITTKLLSLDVIAEKNNTQMDFMSRYQPAKKLYNYLMRNKDRFKLIQNKGEKIFTDDTHYITFNNNLQEINIKRKLDFMRSHYRHYKISKIKNNFRYSISQVHDNITKRVFPRNSKSRN